MDASHKQASKATLFLRIPPQLLEKIEAAARKRGVTRNALVTLLLSKVFEDNQGDFLI